MNSTGLEIGWHLPGRARTMTRAFTIATAISLVAALFTPLAAHGLAHGGGHEPEGHEGHAWEVGFALGAVSLILEDEVAFGAHAHVLRSVPGWERFRVGLGLESVLDEHGHLNAALVVNAHILAGLSVSVAPGVVVLKEADGGWGVQFSSHFEALYEFDLGPVHAGPMLEYSYASVDQHMMLGPHVGFGL